MTPRFLSTGKMAKHIGVNDKFLKENKGVLFKENIHFFVPDGRSHPLWDVEKMVEWVMGKDSDVDEILKKVV